MTSEGRIGESERWFSVILGAMLMLSSLRRRDAAAGALFALGGMAMVYRGVRGEGGFFRALGRAARELLAVEPGAGRQRWSRPGALAGGEDTWDAWDEVDEASAESFPASDAPAWTPTSGPDGA